jgi:phage terminase small subunit
LGKQKIIHYKNMLNERQNKFCLEYLKDFNATQAAKRAGYSERSAKVTAAKMLTNANLLKRIDELKMKQVKKSELKIDAIIKELMKIGFAKVDGDKIKTCDKLKALEMLGKYLGMFNKEKINVIPKINFITNLKEDVKPGEESAVGKKTGGH